MPGHKRAQSLPHNRPVSASSFNSSVDKYVLDAEDEVSVVGCDWRDPGDRIGEYEVVRFLNSGGSGHVVLATHIHTGKEVAIKVILKRNLDAVDLSLVEREVRVMSLLSHPNIAALLETYDLPEAKFLVMEYCNGGDCFEYIQKSGHLPVPEARYVLLKLLDAVAYCHKNGVVHRDLKPGNLLLHRPEPVRDEAEAIRPPTPTSTPTVSDACTTDEGCTSAIEHGLEVAGTPAKLHGLEVAGTPAKLHGLEVAGTPAKLQLISLARRKHRGNVRGLGGSSSLVALNTAASLAREEASLPTWQSVPALCASAELQENVHGEYLGDALLCSKGSSDSLSRGHRSSKGRGLRRRSDRGSTRSARGLVASASRGSISKYGTVYSETSYYSDDDWQPFQVKLTDFGLANIVVSQERIKEVVGTKNYLAPEVFDDGGYQGPAADVWNIGVMTYVLICGFLPFDGETIEDIMENIAQHNLDVQYIEDAECEELIRKMLERDPTKRASIRDVLSCAWLSSEEQLVPGHPTITVTVREYAQSILADMLGSKDGVPHILPSDLRPSHSVKDLIMDEIDLAREDLSKPRRVHSLPFQFGDNASAVGDPERVVEVRALGLSVSTKDLLAVVRKDLRLDDSSSTHASTVELRSVNSSVENDIYFDKNKGTVGSAPGSLHGSEFAWESDTVNEKAQFLRLFMELSMQDQTTVIEQPRGLRRNMSAAALGASLRSFDADSFRKYRSVSALHGAGTTLLEEEDIPASAFLHRCSDDPLSQGCWDLSEEEGADDV